MSILLKQVYTQFYNCLSTVVYISFVYLLYQILAKIWRFKKKRQLIDQIPGPASTWNPLGHINLFRKEGVDMIKSKYMLT